jgi:hypothetical protein
VLVCVVSAIVSRLDRVGLSSGVGSFWRVGFAAPRISAVVYFDDEGAVWLNTEVIPIAEVWEHRATS